MSERKHKRYQQSASRGIPLFWIFAAAVLVALAGVSAVWILSQSSPSGQGQIGPRRQVNKEKIDFGRVPFDIPVRAEFQIRNAGDRELTLDANTPIRVVEGC